jgi:hypothetical protein
MKLDGLKRYQSSEWHESRPTGSRDRAVQVSALPVHLPGCSLMRLN